MQLAPRQHLLEAPTPAAPVRSIAHRSRLVAHVELSLASIAKELEGKVAPRLADERNRSIGLAGHLNYTVDRGPFSIAVEDSALVIRTDIRSHAEACRGNSCYATCEPQGRATATVPLRLTPDYRFPPARVTFAFTRGCEVRALGGLVRIDVTPTIQNELAPSLRRIEQDIDGRLPPPRPQAERLWAELQKTRALPLGGCFVTNPRGIVEGPISGTPAAVRIRFGLAAHPELRSRCGAGTAAPATTADPLPPLTQDPALPAEDDLVLALVSPLSAALSGLEGDQPFDTGAGRARVGRALAISAAPLAQLDLGLRGEVCGDLAVRSGIAWADDGRTLRLATPALAAGEAERAALVSLSAEKLTQGLGTLRFAPALPPEGLKELVPTIAASLSNASLDAKATVSYVKPFDAVVRGEDLAASVIVRGSVELRQL